MRKVISKKEWERTKHNYPENKLDMSIPMHYGIYIPDKFLVETKHKFMGDKFYDWPVDIPPEHDYGFEPHGWHDFEQIYHFDTVYGEMIYRFIMVNETEDENDNYNGKGSFRGHYITMFVNEHINNWTGEDKRLDMISLEWVLSQ